MTVRIASCPVCDYPIAAKYSGQTETCANCGSSLITQGVTMPTWFFAGAIGFILGVILGPALLGSTEAGSRWLAKQAKVRLEK